MSQVLYRKYRPKSFAEIIGQEHVVTTLTNALKNGETAHAYLFTGPRGTGKTTVARLLTKTLNCVSADKADACLKCDICLEVEAGNLMDLIEIDAASARGIDDVRAIKESVRVAPTKTGFKVYLLDEAHMLTKDASNALLKVLEEPPAHVIFILATTEPHKVLPTIISRTQRFDFRFLTYQETENRLKLILKQEGKKMSDEALRLIIATSGGSLRDAESILGKALSLNSTDEEELRAFLGVTDNTKILEFVNLLIKKDKQGGIEFVRALTQEGGDLEQFITDAINLMRTVLFLKLSPPSEELIKEKYQKEELEAIKETANQLTEKEIYGIIKELIESGNSIKFSPVPQLPLELAVINLIGTED